MAALAPGTILQLMYIRERISSLPAGRFIEIGPGSGEISNLLLHLGWHGESFDLNENVVNALKVRFKDALNDGRYTPHCQDYLTHDITQEADLIISSLVLEHLDTNSERFFVTKSLNALSHRGKFICIVPASPAHWGIEDDIAGHYRRYTRDDVRSLFDATGGHLQHIAGLTYPISNFLLPISNYAVKLGESWKLKLPAIEQTKLSGARDVPLKTSFPAVARLILNEKMLWPLHLLQKMFSKCKRAMILYFEAGRLVEE